MLLLDAVEKRSAALRRCRRSERTIRFYEMWLAQLDRSLLLKDLESITLENLQSFVDAVIARGSRDTTIHGCQVSLRVFFGWCKSTGLLAENPAADLEVCELHRKIPDRLDTGEVLALINEAGRSKHPQRDAAIVAFIVETGFRVSEVVRIKLADLDLSSGFVYTVGKGGDQRFVPMGDASMVLLRAWLPVRPATMLTLFGLTEWGIRLMLKRLGDKVGLVANPHKLRRSCATFRALAGASLPELMGLMGWRTPEMARVYVDFAGLVGRGRVTSPMNRISPPSMSS